MSLSKALALASAWLDGEDPPPFETNDIIISSQDGTTSIFDSLLPPPTTLNTTTVNSKNPIEKAISLLMELQTLIISNSLQISSNESLEDVSTSNLELFTVEYHLGRAYLMLPTTTNGSSITTITTTTTSNHSEKTVGNDTHINNSTTLMRKYNVQKAIEYFYSFLKQVHQLGEDVLSEETRKEYCALLERDQDEEEEENDSTLLLLNNTPTMIIPPTKRKNSTTSTTTLGMNPNDIRNMKIRRYQRKQMAKRQIQHLQSLIQRRTRLGLSDIDLLDGYDQELLMRSLHMETLRMYAEEALEEIYASMKELEMIDLSLQYHHPSNNNTTCAGPDDDDIRMMTQRGSSSSTYSSHYLSSNHTRLDHLQMTQITQNPITGQLQLTQHRVTKNNGQLQPIISMSSSSTTTTQNIFQRQQRKEEVFRPGWNLPTMSLEELAQRELSEAMQRSETQKLVEAEAIYKPRRYEQLERDGMEDDANLVEASATLDREWDRWKEDNPRGSGNKMGERGDRNF